MDTFRCGHPRSTENTAKNGTGTACRECKNARGRKRYAADPDASRAAAAERMRKHRGEPRGNANAQKETCPQGHPFDADNTYLYKGNRQCKTCRRRRCRESYARNPEPYLTSHREWYWNNRSKAIALALNWAKANPARAALTSRLKKQRRRAAGVLTAAEWQQILTRYDNRCLRCGVGGPLTIDHVIPVSKGGPNTAANVQPLCASCNSSKSTKATDYRPTPAVERRM